MKSIFLDLSFGEHVNRYLGEFVKAYGDNLHAFSVFVLRYLLIPLEGLLRETPAATLALIGLLAWHATRRVAAALLFVALLYFVGSLGLWDKMMQTLALVLVGALIAIVFGIPIGILMSFSASMRRIFLPVLDVMQTLPSFVYLVPVLMLFGLGKVPAIFATVIYALPPLVRLTDLGIRQVDAEIVEASRAFGSTPSQTLLLVQLPLAKKSIMAGINQTIMMTLSMVVIASMIGARGLGEDVLAGIQTLDVGKGLQAGLAIVILAIVIDRISQGFGRDQMRRLVARKSRDVATANPADGLST